MCNINISLLLSQWRNWTPHTTNTLVQVCWSEKLPNRTDIVEAMEKFLDCWEIGSFTDEFTKHKTQFGLCFGAVFHGHDYYDSFMLGSAHESTTFPCPNPVRTFDMSCVSEFAHFRCYVCWYAYAFFSLRLTQPSAGIRNTIRCFVADMRIHCLR